MMVVVTGEPPCVIVTDAEEKVAPGYESDMPAFSEVLTDEQITQVLEYIKGTWTERAKAYQAARAHADSQ